MEKETTRNVYDRFIELYMQKTGVKPEINFGICGKLLRERLRNHSIKGIIKIIELYFENEKPEAYHLQTILSAYFINKYAPRLKLNPLIYENAEQYNKEVY